MRYLLLLLLFSATFWACQPEEACVSSATSRVVVDFYVPIETELGLDTIRRDSIQFTKVTGAGASNGFLTIGRDSTVGLDSTARVILRLNPDKDTSTFYFEGIFYSGNSRAKINFKDTLVMHYQRRYRLISPDCPLEVSFEQLQVVRSTLDSVRVINAKLVEPSTEMDVQVIFFR